MSEADISQHPYLLLMAKLIMMPPALRVQLPGDPFCSNPGWSLPAPTTSPKAFVGGGSGRRHPAQVSVHAARCGTAASPYRSLAPTKQKQNSATVQCGFCLPPSPSSAAPAGGDTSPGLRMAQVVSKTTLRVGCRDRVHGAPQGVQGPSGVAMCHPTGLLPLPLRVSCLGKYKHPLLT